MNTLIFMSIAMLLVGVGVATWGVRHHRRNGLQYADASTRWHKTQGTVLDARIVERERTDSNDNSYTGYDPRLRYRYAIGADVREGERINLCNPLSFSDPERAERWLAAHAPGAPIEIWYDPTQPANCACTLDKPNLFGAIVTVAVGLGVAALGVWMVFNLR